MIKYGLIILKKYDVIYGVQTKNDLIWNDNQELKVIIFEHAITNNIEYLIKNYINCVYTSNSNIENICIYQDSTLNLKRKSISIEKDTTVRFYISHDNKTFLTSDVVDKKEFFKEIGLRNVDDEWKEFQEKCENEGITPMQLNQLLKNWRENYGK